jgi:hypothetical protein
MSQVSNHYELLIPVEVTCNRDGYEYLSKVAGATLAFSNTILDLNFKNCTWFDGNLCAVLGNILDGLVQRHNQISLVGMNDNIENIFSRNFFLKSFSSNAYLNLSSLTIPYKKFKLEDEQAIKDFIKVELFDKPDMPQMSNEAKKSILVNIFEVCVNAITHGNCEYVYCCGQFFPHRTPAKVSISFVDLGRTIKANVNDYLKDQKNGNETIIWALKDGNTTKTGNEPGGIGLKLLQDLVNLNKGKLQIVSADGFIELKNGEFSENTMNVFFPGTIVTVELILGDSNFYILSTETNKENIF